MMVIMKRTWLVGMLFLSTLGMSADTPVTKAPTYSAEQTIIHGLMEELFKNSRNVNSAEKKTARDNLRKAMDWNGIARKCLGTAWKKQSAKNRNRFRRLLQEVIILSAFDRLDKFWTDETVYSFSIIAVKKQTAHVAVQFVVDDEPFMLEYYFKRTKKVWLIEDVAYEEFRYSENINEQITAFLKEFNFAKLLDKLRKRRDELKESKKTEKG